MRCRGENAFVWLPWERSKRDRRVLVERKGAARLECCMEKFTAYLISAGMLAFGIWMVATAELRWGSLMFWPVVGMAPIAVGAASLANEIDNERKVAKSNNQN